MANWSIVAVVALVTEILGCIFTIVSLSTSYWGELDKTFIGVLSLHHNHYKDDLKLWRNVSIEKLNIWVNIRSRIDKNDCFCFFLFLDSGLTPKNISGHWGMFEICRTTELDNFVSTNCVSTSSGVSGTNPQSTHTHTDTFKFFL